MAGIPQEPEAFAEFVAQTLRRMQPDTPISFSGPKELLINGRRLDLENLFRMVKQEPRRGREIVEHYLDQLFAGDTTQWVEMSFDFARERIMPRVQPESIFEHLSREMVAHVPFVNNTVVVFVTDLPQMTVSITTEQLIRWGVSVEEVDDIARHNLDTYVPELEFQVVQSKDGGTAAILSEHDGYDAARLLLSGLHPRLSPQLGHDFLVATPARDMFVAVSSGPGTFLRRIQKRVCEDFKRLPYPISDGFFLVTRDGVAGTMEEQREEAA